ncbi:hypothetical protein J2T15_005978 [Paenibacillus harenae]|uniref:DUF418 domain-containing protein n=1 Tax=Paenibacillus harenae TaxID=306543 RepID=A0ABT9UA25_PAEHA|nr:hypothetical protein [Paenibacillus harenae]
MAILVFIKWEIISSLFSTIARWWILPLKNKMLLGNWER